MVCSQCFSENIIILRNTCGIEKGFKNKDDYIWSIDIYFCIECNNIFGIKS